MTAWVTYLYPLSRLMIMSGIRCSSHQVLSALPRISRSCLKFGPVYPDDIKQLNITGICYLGSKLNFTLTKEKTTIKMTQSSSNLHLSALEVVLAGTGEHLSLKEGVTLFAIIRTAHTATYDLRTLYH